MKKLLKKISFGVATGCFGFVAMLFIASAFAGGANTFFAENTGEEWLQLAACFIIISMGFFVPSLIYDNEKLVLWLRTLIHMTIGTIVYLLTAYFVGWMKAGVGTIVVYILIAVGVAAIIWAIFMLGFKLQANKINKTIQDKRQNGNSD